MEYIVTDENGKTFAYCNSREEANAFLDMFPTFSCEPVNYDEDELNARNAFRNGGTGEFQTR